MAIISRRRFVATGAAAGAALYGKSAWGEAPERGGVRRPTVIGSQGAAGLAPENTLAAVEAALEAGADGVELDLHLSADGALVAHHDFFLNRDMARTADGAWLDRPGPPIKSLTLAELKTYDVGRIRSGSRLEDDYPDQVAVDGEPIATLAEVTALLQARGDAGAEIWAEIKSNPQGRDAVVSPPDEFVEALAPFLDDEKAAARYCIIAFDWRVLRAVGARWPHVRTGYLTVDPKWIAGFPETATGTPDAVAIADGRDYAMLRAGFTDPAHGSTPKAVKAAGGTYWSPFIGDLSPALVAEAHGLGLRVSTWAADSQDLMKRALDLKVDSVTNSRPDLMKALRDTPPAER